MLVRLGGFRHGVSKRFELPVLVNRFLSSADSSGDVKDAGMMKKVLWVLIALIGIVGIAAIVSKDVRRFFTLYADGQSDLIARTDMTALSESEQAAMRFVGGDWGALSTDTLSGSATPWRLTATVITLDYVDGDRNKLTHENLRAAFQQWGFTSPSSIANWPGGLEQPSLDAPLGITVGTVSRRFPSIEITAANLGCTSCHSSVVYDATGAPDPNLAWIGAPNGSINLEAYPQAIYDGFLAYGDAPDLLDAAQILFPEMTALERKTLTSFVLPAATKRIAELEATTGRAIPFKSGYPGATNGLDALKLRLGLADPGDVPTFSAFNSVPNLEDHEMRSSFLNAASYQIAGFGEDRPMTRGDVTDAHLDALGAVVAYFTVPSMGVDIATAAEGVPHAQTVMRFVATYETQPFPGVVEASQAALGREIYAADCASCHGTYEETDAGPKMTEFPNHVSDIGTDMERIGVLTEDFARAVNKGPMGKHIFVPEVKGYSAPSLSGAWMSAPYFHNGSVPTLWALMTPAARPSSFPVGGQRLDFEDVGIDLEMRANGTATYPSGYTPWALPVVFDTQLKGQSNQGHEAAFEGYSDAQKRALIEYLKTL